MTTPSGDGWLAGDAYDAYMGRWSRLAARLFIEWLPVEPSAHWLEVGCGTGALTRTICDLAAPASVTACDPSGTFITHARGTLSDGRVEFAVAGADALPQRTGGFDAAVSGLVLNFLPDPEKAVGSCCDRLRRGGLLAAYVWAYADGMDFLQIFWDTAVALDPGAATLDEGRRFPVCQPVALESLWRAAGLSNVETRAVDIATDFPSFEDYWTPFLHGTGPAPRYVASLSPANREALRRRLHDRLPGERNGPIRLRARAWAVRGVRR